MFSFGSFTINYRPQRSWGKVIFLHLFVILFTGGHAWLLLGGCVVAPGGGVVAPGGGVWLLLGGRTWLLGGACVVAPGGMHGCLGGAWLLQVVCVVAPGGGGHAWNMTRYGDTVNEWAVRILLECILVLKYTYMTFLYVRFYSCGIF